jgi:hypothetical protein
VIGVEHPDIPCIVSIRRGSSGWIRVGDRFVPIGNRHLPSERGELFDRVVAVVLTPENSGEPVVAQLIFLDRVQATIVFA